MSLALHARIPRSPRAGLPFDTTKECRTPADRSRKNVTTEARPPQVGETVADFKLATFEPTKGGFGEFSLEENRKAGRWTILFFYPADFTFV